MICYSDCTTEDEGSLKQRKHALAHSAYPSLSSISEEKKSSGGTLLRKCHLCDFTFSKKEKRKVCHCKKHVHHNCFIGDGDSCPKAPK